MEKDVVILRYGHRIVRDYRVSSHCCLVARAFGASRVIIIGSEDASLKERIGRIVENWGGNFVVEFASSWKKIMDKYKKRGYTTVHATMYGMPLQEEIKKIRAFDKILLVIGSQKVEKGVYENSDYNISVTLQPHSEIAALAIFLDHFFEGKELGNGFVNAKQKIIPQKTGKKVFKKK